MWASAVGATCPSAPCYGLHSYRRTHDGESGEIIITAIESFISCTSTRKQRMSLRVLKMSISLDGSIAPPDGSTDWVAAGDSDVGLNWVVETVGNADAPLFGAATYELGATHWLVASVRLPSR